MITISEVWHSLYPEGSPSYIDLPCMSIYEMLQRAAQSFPTHTAIISQTEELSYKKFKTQCDCFANTLYSRGVRKGDRIAVMLPNSKEYLIAYFALQRLGGILVQVNTMYQHQELKHILQDSMATWFVCFQNQKELLDKTDVLNDVETIIIEENEKRTNIMEQLDELPTIDINPIEDVAVLQYTGGTTGKPKAVMLTHHNLVSNANQNMAFYALQPQKEIILGNSPVFHVMGLSYINITVFSVGTYIVVERFTVENVLALIKKHRPTIFVGAPTMYVKLLQSKDLKEGDLECFHICACGSAPLPMEIIHEFEKKSGAAIVEAYGMSETLVTHRNPNTSQRKIGSIGVPLPNTECKIVDSETGEKEMLIGQPGELIIKGPQVMKGYWRNEEATKETIKDGWLYSGDIGMMDEDGRFYIVGRKKEVIIASGFNIYPMEVEDVLYQHPSIEEACVFGVPDSYRGENVKAIIVLKENQEATSEEVENWCRERLASFKIPRIIEFRQSLPKTAVGKILKRQLVEEELSRK